MRFYPSGVLLVTVFAISLPASAQKKEKPVETYDIERVFTKIEINAGTNTQDWFCYTKESTVLPDSLAKTIPAGTYKVLISFIVNTDGKLSDVKADNDPGYGLAGRALKIFSGYKGKWTPANQCGRSVKSYEKRPIIFVVGG
jgi:protein TonB